MNDIMKYNKWVSNLFAKMPFSKVYDFKEKDNNVFTQILYMLNRTQSLFEYSGLPDTIPSRILEIYLQVNGHCCFTEVNGQYYVFTGGLGGEPDVYYMPTIYTVSNPAINYTRNLHINDDCIVISNDSMYMGLMPLFNKYASMIAENELSLSLAIVNSRIIDLIVAEDDATKESAEEFLNKVFSGELGVIGSNAFISGLKTLPYASDGRSNNITQLIEFEQYAKAAWLNEIGLNANYNMKREALSTAESQLNDDALRPLVDDLLHCREIALEEINNKYGLDISVKLGSSWETNDIEEQAEVEAMINAIQTKEDPEDEQETDPEDEQETDPEDEQETDPEETERGEKDE